MPSDSCSGSGFGRNNLREGRPFALSQPGLETFEPLISLDQSAETVSSNHRRLQSGLCITLLAVGTIREDGHACEVYVVGRMGFKLARQRCNRVCSSTRATGWARCTFRLRQMYCSLLGVL